MTDINAPTSIPKYATDDMLAMKRLTIEQTKSLRDC